jgi:prevent-host-death family protein
LRWAAIAANVRHMSDKMEQQDDGAAARAREAPLIGSRTLHRHTKDVLDRVERGESVVILRYGRPAAALVPIDEERAQAIVLASSPELDSDSAEVPDAAAEAAAEPFAVASAEIDSDEQDETWVIETLGMPLNAAETTVLATFADTQREIRSGVSELLGRLDRQERALAALARGHAGAGADAGPQAAKTGEPDLT